MMEYVTEGSFTGTKTISHKFLSGLTCSNASLSFTPSPFNFTSKLLYAQ